MEKTPSLILDIASDIASRLSGQFPTIGADRKIVTNEPINPKGSNPLWLVLQLAIAVGLVLSSTACGSEFWEKDNATECPFGQHLELDEIADRQVCVADSLTACTADPGQQVAKTVRFLCDNGQPADPSTLIVAYAPIGETLAIVPAGFDGRFTFALRTCEEIDLSINGEITRGTTEQILSQMAVPGDCVPDGSIDTTEDQPVVGLQEWLACVDGKADTVGVVDASLDCCNIYGAVGDPDVRSLCGLD